MSGGVRQLEKGEILFRENDESDAMYVIKKGRIAITKSKGSGEIILAELGPGQMLGEMAFFDNRPRSAGAKAAEKAEVIALPFESLYAQFKTFPEWLKAMVKTVNSHLRDANQRIKNLERLSKEDEEFFTDHLITRLTAIISLIGFKSGQDTEEGLVIPSGLLRNYCIQVFQQPTNKLNKMMEVYKGLGYMDLVDMGEGQVKTIIKNHKLLTSFVDWYNKWLFEKEDKRIHVAEKELPIIKGLLFYADKVKEEGKDDVTVNLTEIQNESMKDLNYVVSVNDADSLAEKGLVNDKVSGEGGVLTMTFNYKDLAEIFPYWEIIYTLKKVSG